MTTTKNTKKSGLRDESISIAGMRAKLAAIQPVQAEITTPQEKKSEQTRRKKLEGLLSQLRRGKNVPNSLLKRWLTDEEYAGFEEQWQSQLELREQLKNKPDSIITYEEMLRKARFFENRAEGYRGKNSKTAASFRRQAESHYEEAVEHLKENLSVDPSLEMWLDWQPVFCAGGNISLESGGVPLVITSRSSNNTSDRSNWGAMSKIDVKADVVERAVEACDNWKN